MLVHQPWFGFASVLGAVYWNNFEVTFFTDSAGSFCQWFTFMVYTLCIRSFKNQGVGGLYIEKLPIPSSGSNFPNGCSTQEENVTSHTPAEHCSNTDSTHRNQRAHMAYTCVHVCVCACMCVLVYTWSLFPWYCFKTVSKELVVLAVLIFTVNVQRLHLWIP